MTVPPVSLDPPSAESGAEVNRRIGRSSLALMLVHAAAYGARFFKVIIIAAFFGTGLEIATYQAAINLPLAINGVLFGALVTGAVPILVEIRSRRSDRDAAQLWTRLGAWSLVAVAALCLGLGLVAGQISRWITDPTRHDAPLAAHLLRLLLGYLALYFVIQFITLIFHSHHRFTAPLLAALPNLAVNIVVIVVWFFWIRVEVAALVWGLYAGAVVQLVILLIVGWRWHILRPAWGPSPDLGRTVRNSLILLLSGLVSPVTLITVDIVMAAPVPRGVPTLSYAYAMFMFPVTVGVMNLGYVLLPFLSGQVAARDWEGLSQTVSLTTRMLLFITVPVAVGLWLVSEDLVRVVLQRGEFTEGDTLLVAAALRAYMLGLVFAGLTVIVTKIHNALQRVWALFAVSCVAFAIKILLNALLRESLGVSGIALATGLFYLLSFVLLALLLRSHVGLRPDPARLRAIGTVVLGGALMVGVVHLARQQMIVHGVPLTAVLALEVVLGGLVWVLFSALARVPEFRLIWRLVLRREGAVGAEGE